MTDIAFLAKAKAASRPDESALVKQRVRAAMWFLLPMLAALAVLADPAWGNAVGNTVRFAVVSVAFVTVCGVIVAVVLNAEFPGRGIVRAAVLVPWAIPTIVSARM